MLACTVKSDAPVAALAVLRVCEPCSSHPAWQGRRVEPNGPVSKMSRILSSRMLCASVARLVTIIHRLKRCAYDMVWRELVK